MKSSIPSTSSLLLLLIASQASTSAKPQNQKSSPLETEQQGWYQLFNGINLDDWTASENADSFKVVNGMIQVDGPRSHLFYDGPIQAAIFKDFELEVEVKTSAKANSGIYFHTEFQNRGWPCKGYEAQINNTHSDFKKTGSLYAIRDLKQSPVQDNQWFSYGLKVQDRTIEIKINDQSVNVYTEPRRLNRPHRQLDQGKIALQSHDTTNKVWFRSIKVKPLNLPMIAQN